MDRVAKLQRLRLLYRALRGMFPQMHDSIPAAVNPQVMWTRFPRWDLSDLFPPGELLMKTLLFASVLLACAAPALANDTLYLEPSESAEPYYTPSPVLAEGAAHAASYGHDHGAYGYSGCGGKGCGWGCCDRPCSRNLHLWDGYCESKNYSPWTFGHAGCGGHGGYDCSSCR
jgi:hypothetical protein